MTDKVLCRYFAVNACKKGDTCPFSHNLKDQPSNVCTFYLRGNCSYGSNCRYEHVAARKLAETQGWGPLAAKLLPGGHFAPESSPPSVLASARSPSESPGRTQIESPIPTRPASADKRGVDTDGGVNGSAVPSSGKSWAALAAKPLQELELEKNKPGGGKKASSEGEKEQTKVLENGHFKDPQGVLPNTSADPPTVEASTTDTSTEQEGGSSKGPAELVEQAETAKGLPNEEFDVQRGAWRPPHLQEGGSSPEIPHSISPGLNSSAKEFSPSGGQYIPAVYSPHMVPGPGGALLGPPYENGVAFEDSGIAYGDNGLPDDLWDWVDQMTISDQDEYAAMQGVAYMPGQPYPQSFSPSPPIAYVPGHMYPQAYSPGPYYSDPHQYPPMYPDGSYPQPYLNSPQVYPANPPPVPTETPQSQTARPKENKSPETPGLVRNNSLEDFPHLASSNPSVSSNSVSDNPKGSPAEQPICAYAAAGDCPREKDGGTCGQLHGDMCPSCGKRCLHPHRPEERKEHLEGCERRAKKLKQLQRSREVECCVCLERILAKQRVAERKFGILSGCDHAFCIGCIRGWRSGDHTTPGMDLDTVVRSCPVCRVQSYFVTPSVVWYSSPEEKEQIVEGYKRKLKGIDCRHFNYGDGSCPFGTSCFYRHRFRDGREEEVTLRHLGTADGKVTIAKSVRLSDFIDLSAIKKRR